MRAILDFVRANRALVLGVALTVMVGVGLWVYGVSESGDFGPGRGGSAGKGKGRTLLRHAASPGDWGGDPFVSPFEEARRRHLQEEERKKREREEMERRKREEEEKLRRQREEEERKRKEEEARRRREEEKRRLLEAEKKRLRDMVRSLTVSGVVHDTEGRMAVFLDGRRYETGEKVWCGEEPFLVKEVTRTGVVLEDRLGQRHTLGVER